MNGADISRNNYYGLKYARYKGYTEIVDYLENYMKEKGLKESLLNILEGPNAEDVWKKFGYEKIFNTYQDFLDYKFNNLEIIKNIKYPNSYFYSKDDKILFEVDDDANYIYVDYFEIWLILEKIFSLDYITIRRILKNEIHNKFNTNDAYTVSHMSNRVNSRWWWNEKNHRDYKQIKESLLNKLKGPSEEEFHDKFLSDEISLYDYFNICQKNNLTTLPKDIILNKIYGKTFENTIEYFDFLIQDIKNVTPKHWSTFIRFGKDGKGIIIYDKDKNSIYFNTEIMNILILVFKSSCNELIKPLNNFIKDKLKIDTNVKIDFNYLPLSWDY